MSILWNFFLHNFQVKPVAYVMLNLNSIIHTSVSHLHTLPVGAKLLYSVSYHDDVGEMFHTTSTKLRYRPNRFDLLQVSPGAENNTLVARATDVGQTVLKVGVVANCSANSKRYFHLMIASHL